VSTYVFDTQQNTDFQGTLSYHNYDAVLYGITLVQTRMFSSTGTARKPIYDLLTA